MDCLILKDCPVCTLLKWSASVLLNSWQYTHRLLQGLPPKSRPVVSLLTFSQSFKFTVEGAKISLMFWSLFFRHLKMLHTIWKNLFHFFIIFQYVIKFPERFSYVWKRWFIFCNKMVFLKSFLLFLFSIILKYASSFSSRQDL